MCIFKSQVSIIYRGIDFGISSYTETAGDSLGSLLSGGDLEDLLVSCSLAAALRAEPWGTPEGPRFVTGMCGALLLGEAMLVGTVRVWSQFPESCVCESISH